MKSRLSVGSETQDSGSSKSRLRFASGLPTAMSVVASMAIVELLSG